MAYDFTTLVDRRHDGSEKWNQMYKASPELPGGIVPFSVADMELRCAPEITEGLKKYLDETILGYSCRTPAYENAVCGWMRDRHGWDVDPSWMVESSGVVPALYAAVRANTEPGDGVLVMTPVYYPFFHAIVETGRRLVASDLVVRDGRYKIDYDDLARKASDASVKVLILCSPHNPVGRVWTRDELSRVAQIAFANGLVVVSDEIHFDITLPGHDHTVFSTLSDEAAEKSIVCTAPSKTFNLAGLQASNIIVPNKGLRRGLRKALGGMCIFSLNSLGYKACELAYTHAGAWLDAFLVHLAGNRDFAESYLREYIPEIKVFALEGTYLQWWDCRGLGMGYEELEKFMTEEALLFLDEGYIFGEAGRGFERINLACPRGVLEGGLERLKDAVEKRR